MEILVIVLALALLILIPFGLGWRKRSRRLRREELYQKPFPEAWDAILQDRFDLYPHLPAKVKRRMQGLTNVFLDEKNFEACGKLSEVTEEMKVLIAAQACLLLVGLEKHNYFAKLQSILVYPEAFRNQVRRRFSLPDEHDEVMRLGESWGGGSVVLSWQSVLKGAQHDHDGQNVVFHEFAHQLDQVNGVANGTPTLTDREEYGRWYRVMSTAYQELLEEVEQHQRDSVLDGYGATNPAEFFAVATEAFFERAGELFEEHPDLYEEMKSYFGTDPRQWQAISA